MGVLFSFEAVFDQNQLLFRGVIDPIKRAAGSTFLDWRNLNPGIDIEPRKMNPRLAKERLGSH
jgi:hypothetical protein